jgi:zinc D-Ala-D-Ala carboxypeptidase
MTRYPNKTHYSKHFTRAELDCKCGCKTPRKIQRRLARLARRLEKLRKILGRSLGILSAYRCKRRNDEVGGAKDSMHLYGLAADLKVPRGKQGVYVNAATKVHQFRRGGIGVYPHGGVHVDMRGIIGRARARWNSWKR